MTAPTPRRPPPPSGCGSRARPVCRPRRCTYARREALDPGECAGNGLPASRGRGIRLATPAGQPQGLRLRPLAGGLLGRARPSGRSAHRRGERHRGRRDPDRLQRRGDASRRAPGQCLLTGRRARPCSVMVFREGHPASPAHLRSVLVGLDGSRGCMDALAMAQELAAALEARLVLCAAYPTGVAFAPPTSELRDELRAHARSVVDAARRTVPGKPEIIEELGEGRARDVLLRACEHRAPAVLVLDSRGLGGFTRSLLGSTSRWLANHAPCPVLIARRRWAP